MDKPLNHESSETLSPLTRLNIIIHPFYRTRPFEPEYSNRMITDRQRMVKNFLTRMTPGGMSEATLIMPMVNSGGKSDLQSSIASAKSSETGPSWIDIYREFVSEQGHGRNIILGTDIIPDFKSWSAEPNVLKADLSKRGFKISPETEIVVGGELLNACLRQGVEKLLTLPEVKRLKVDKKCVLTIDYLFNNPTKSTETSFSVFELSIKQRGYNLMDSEDYYSISKA